MTSTPTATWPYRARVSLRSASALTTNTVLENDKAKASRAMVDHASPASSPTPRTVSTPSSPTPMITMKLVCRIAVPHTSRRSSWRTSSLSPTAKSNSVTPRSARVANSGTR